MIARLEMRELPRCRADKLASPPGNKVITSSRRSARPAGSIVPRILLTWLTIMDIHLAHCADLGIHGSRQEICALNRAADRRDSAPAEPARGARASRGAGKPRRATRTRR